MQNNINVIRVTDRTSATTGINGRMIMQQEVTNKQTMQMNIAGIKQGVYFIQVIDEQGITQTLEFVK